MHHHGAGLRRLLVARKWEEGRVEALLSTLATDYRQAEPAAIELSPPAPVPSGSDPNELSPPEQVPSGSDLSKLGPPERALVDQAAPDLPPADRAMLNYASKLTRRPEEMTSADAERLRVAGFDDRAIHDICAVTAYFAFVNRIADGLGVELEST